MSTSAGRLETGHVGLNVSDLERSKRFYQEVFGFVVAGESTEEGRRYALLGDGSKLVLTLWEQSEGRFPAGLPGLHHLSFQADSMAKVEEAERKVRGLGATIHHDGIVAHGEGASSGGIFFEDPDGIRLEIFSATGATGRRVPAAAGPACGFF
jgi:catechol 2,3-dioxygenase-like lactoylglutathione lyase family enzyme